MRLKKGLILGAALMVLAPVVAVLNAGNASAAQITARSLTLVATGTDGGSKPSGVVGHQFSFTIPSGTSIGSVKFEYCTTASVTACTLPAGVSTTGATLGSVSGWATGTTLTATTNGAPYISKTAASGSGAVTVRLNNVTNPSAVNSTFFVRISTYVATNGTGSPVDTGTVAASTAEPIVLTGTMPESLIFCTGATVTVNCASSTPGTVTFNQLFSPTDTAVGSGLLFGYYTAEVTVKYGSNGQEVKSQTGFWVIPWKLILLGVALLVLAFFVLRIMIRRYNRAIVQRATGVKYEKPVKQKATKAAKTPKTKKPRK